MSQSQSATERLAQALDRDARPANKLAAAGVSIRQAANAICGRPVATIAYLRICRAINFDPLPELMAPVAPPGLNFDFAMLAMGLKIRRGVNRHSDREAAAAMNLGAATVCRVERAECVQIGVVLKVCSYIGVHPFGYMREGA